MKNQFNIPPLSLDEIDDLIKKFEIQEKYEICAELLRHKNKRLDHKNNYTLLYYNVALIIDCP